jgi:hypothetical protein
MLTESLLDELETDALDELETDEFELTDDEDDIDTEFDDELEALLGDDALELALALALELALELELGNVSLEELELDMLSQQSLNVQIIITMISCNATWFFTTSPWVQLPLFRDSNRSSSSASAAFIFA